MRVVELRNPNMANEQLVEMDIKRLKIMEENMKEFEEIQEDGLVVLLPQSVGDIINIDNEGSMDGMNIVDFEEEV